MEPWIANLNSKAGDIILFNYKNYFKAMVVNQYNIGIKIDRIVNRIGHRNPCVCGQLIFNMKAKDAQ